MPTPFKQRLRSGELLIGTFYTVASPDVAELLALIGYDWLFVDMEHSPFTVADVQRAVQIAEPKCPCVVRVPTDDEVWLKKILDTGAAGILIPHIQSAEQAERILRSCKYPPAGERSVGIGRAQGYGFRLQEYIDRANEDIAVIMQVEDVEGVKHIETIVRVPGIDAVFVGPYDMSGSMGKLGKVRDEDVLTEIGRVADACKNANIPLGVFGVSVEHLSYYIERGFTLIAAGADTLFLGQAAKKTFDRLKSQS